MKSLQHLPKLVMAIAVIGAMTFSAATASAACRYSKSIRHVFDSEQFKALDMRALAGLLEVQGTSSDEIEFTGSVCASDEESLERISLEVEESGDTLQLTVVIPFRDRGFDPDYAFVDVDLRVPKDFPVSLRDSSGDIFVDEVFVTEIDDSSGNIRVTNGRTNLTIEDSSGNMDIRQLTGDLTIEDSSGEIVVRGIRGNVIIPRDSSGDIEIEDVSGRVLVERDSSGDIEISKVKKEVSIESDGAGDIEISDVDGNVTIGRDGSGGIYIDEIRGNFELLAKGSGGIRVRDVAGIVKTPR